LDLKRLLKSLPIEWDKQAGAFLADRTAP